MTSHRLRRKARDPVDRSHAAYAGYSLIEFVVAMGILAIVVTQVTLVLTTQHRNYVQQEGVSDSQQDVRLLTEAVLADLRMGGFMVPRETAVGSIDGGNGASDVLCVSDPSAFAATSYSTATDRFDGASVSNVMLGSNSSVTLPVGDLDIDGDSVLTVGSSVSHAASFHRCAGRPHQHSLLSLWTQRGASGRAICPRAEDLLR